MASQDVKESEVEACVGGSANLETPEAPSVFGNQLQELVFRAVMETTTALMKQPSKFLPTVETSGSSGPLVCTDALRVTSLWNEATFNKAEARRKRELVMGRTSAGENSDSQEDFQIPENESPQQRSLRTQRLNRLRVKRAKELACNCQALDKLPFVLYVDGSGKAKGIHRHKWRAAVRGQCGRLDPSLDNINHHPKHVVDSIWNVLETEWEFEGFAHRAREMFEKSATKFMRNRKMQLKYKCRRIVDGTRPNDLTSTHWANIVVLTKKTLIKNTMIASSGKEGLLEKNGWAPKDVHSDQREVLQLQGTKKGTFNINYTTGNMSLNPASMSSKFSADDGDISRRIERLQEELWILQESKKVNSDNAERRMVLEGGQHLRIQMSKETMKENIKPISESGQFFQGEVMEEIVKNNDLYFKGKEIISSNDKKISLANKGKGRLEPQKSRVENIDHEMECGDIVRLISIIDGKEKEVAKGILMGLAGTKFARKVIPNGWSFVKVSAVMFSACTVRCPLPSGWAETVKQITMKEAMEKTVVWPHSLLHNLLHA